MKRIIINLVFVLILIQGAIAQSGFQGYIDSGNGNLKVRNYKEAMTDFGKAIKEQPTDTAAMGGMIKACLLGDDLKEAEKHIENALKVYPKSAEFMFRRGILNNMKGDFEKAFEDLTDAISFGPSNNLLVQIYLNLGATQLKLESFDAALDNYNKGLTLSPRNPSLYNYRGYANYKLGNFVDAIKDYDNAIDLDANNPASYYNRGMALIKTANKSKACLDFHKSCKLGNMNACKMIMIECKTK